MQTLELLEKCWNLKCHFNGTWNSLKIRILTWKSTKTLEICECLLFTLITVINSTKIIQKISKGKFEEIIWENSWYAKKYPVFSILGFVCIHTSAVDVNLGLLENIYVRAWSVFENSLNLNVKILHKPWRDHLGSSQNFEGLIHQMFLFHARCSTLFSKQFRWERNISGYMKFMANCYYIKK